MSQGNFCKHCRVYQENHIDANCPNGKFELFVFDPKEIELMRKLLKQGQLQRHLEQIELSKKEKEKFGQKIISDLNDGVHLFR